MTPRLSAITELRVTCWILMACILIAWWYIAQEDEE